MSRFEYTDPEGCGLHIAPVNYEDGPSLLALIGDPKGKAMVARIPLDHVEEVVAGLRDMARQAGGQRAPSSPCMCGMPDDEEGVHPTNGDPCYTTALSVGELAAVRARRAAGQPGPTKADAMAMLNRMAAAAANGPCMCGHRKDEHVTVSGRLLCDSCDPDDTTRPTCTGYITLAPEAEGQQS